MPAFCVQQEDDESELLMEVHETVADSEAEELTTMHVLGGQSVAFAEIDTRL